nr:lipoate protein ligase C-terminal domain-containing protein [Bacillus subtilis]WGD90436.1 lipoate protein ligase C-terminal domain-containing protein [Bacillus subtilis]WGE07415.1 lipoate protein ligase C-terminal domain-containing protein [Bacillus subtilis]
MRLEVKKGKIEDCKIFGDFFGVGDVSEIENLLVGKQYERSVIADVLEGVNLKHYFGNITKEDFLDLIY